MRTRTKRGAAGCTALALCFVTASEARAQDNKAAAEVLFEEGRKLMKDGAPADACPKFADSERLDSSPSTLLNLANCYEKIGKSASAWATYKEAESLATAVRRADLVAVSQKRAAALEPTLTRVAITMASPANGMEVRRDGTLVDRAEWGVAIPLDPGPHQIDASAPRRRSWGTTVEVKAAGTTQTVTVPALEELPSEASQPAASVVTDPAASASPPAVPTPPPAVFAVAPTGGGLGFQRTLGIVVGAAGLVGLGIGGAFALSANSKYQDSLSMCPNNKDLCTLTGVSERNNARAFGDVATVAVTVGALALATGLVVLLTAPSGHAEHTQASAQAGTIAMSPTLGGASVWGTW